MAREEYKAEVFEIKKAVRHKVPQVIGIYGVTFSGKTYGAFMLAAGLMKPGGKLGFIDTENGRGSAYADDPDIVKLFPQGFHILELHPPFHPRRYIDAIKQFQREGFDLIIGDSFSHAWEGEGGALDIKEKDAAWNNAKMWSKRLKFAIVYSSVDIIVCLRGMEKTKVTGKGRDQVYTPLGIMPICEKSLPFDLGVSIRVEGSVDGKPATHLATPDKWQKGLNWLFEKWAPQLLTKEIGLRIREWNEGGAAFDEVAVLQRDALYAAHQGTKEYAEFFTALDAGRRKFLADTTHAKNKEVAAAADIEELREAESAKPSPLQERLDRLKASPHFSTILGGNGYADWSEVPVEKRVQVVAECETDLATFQ